MRFGKPGGLRPRSVDTTLANSTRTHVAPVMKTLPVETVPLDKLHEECGVFAIYGHPEAANLTYLGLYALQHRGQESSGIATSDGRQVRCYKDMGHVADIFA